MTDFRTLINLFEDMAGTTFDSMTDYGAIAYLQKVFDIRAKEVSPGSKDAASKIDMDRLYKSLKSVGKRGYAGYSDKGLDKAFAVLSTSSKSFALYRHGNSIASNAFSKLDENAVEMIDTQVWLDDPENKDSAAHYIVEKLSSVIVSLHASMDGTMVVQFDEVPWTDMVKYVAMMRPDEVVNVTEDKLVTLWFD